MIHEYGQSHTSALSRRSLYLSRSSLVSVSVKENSTLQQKMEKEDKKRSDSQNPSQPHLTTTIPSPPPVSHLNLESPHLSPLSSSTSSLSNSSPPPSDHLPDTKAPPLATAAPNRTDPAAPGSHLNLQSPPSDSAPGSPLSSNISTLSHDSPPPPSQQPESNPPQAIVSYSKAVPRAPDRPAPPPPEQHLKLKSLLSDSSPDSPLSHASSPSPPHHLPDAIPPSAAGEATPTVPNGRAQGKVSKKKVGDGSSARFRPGLSILRKSREGSLRKALLAFRISGSIFCLISFSVMAADRDRGWALDSFYRYEELRYCMGVNVIGFVYSGFQAFDLALQMITRKHTARFRYYLDFVLDQMLTYLLVSASSSASVRIDEWQSNWGKDKFPEMATASVGLSFVAFIALALSSLVSGYFLCTVRAT